MTNRFNATRVMRFMGLAVIVAIVVGMAPADAGAAALRGSSYTSDNFGYSLSWDDSIWEAEESTESDGVRLTSDASFGLIQAVGYEGDLADCVADSITGLAGGDNVEDFGEASRKLDRPQTAREAEGELFTYIDLDNNGAEITMYIECRGLDVDGALLQVILLSFEADYADAVVTWEGLLDEVDTGGNSNSNTRGEDEPKDDDNGQDAPESGLDGDVYVAPELGFSATWDEDVWSVRELDEDEGLGTGIEVATEYSFGWITAGDELGVDFDECAVTFAEGFSEYEAISRFREASRKMDLPATDRDAVGALYTFTQTPEEGESIKMVGYFECRLLEDDLGVASIFLATSQNVYEVEVGLWEELLDGIEIDGAARSEDENVESHDDPVESSDEPIETKNESFSNVDASFVGPNFGFSVALDESVWTIGDRSDDENDFLDMESEFAIGTIVGFGAVYDPAACIELMIGLKVGEQATTFDVAPASMERPELARGAVGELFVYTLDGDSGPIELAMYVECRPLAGGDASLGIALITVPEAYEVAAPEFNLLLAGISTAEEA